MKAGWTISAIGHTAVLAWGLVVFVGRPAHSPPPPDFLSADIVSDADLSRITQGIRTAKLAEAPKPLVEKIGEAKPTENPNSKVVDKPEIVPTADQLQPKPEPEKKPEPKKAEPKPPESKPEPKQAFAKEEPKPDPIAEALKKDNTKPEKKPEKKAETPPPKKQEPKQQPKFDSSRIAALLDKRDPQRRAATGSTLSDAPSLGTATGQAASLSQNEIDALRNRLRQCWSVPVGLAEARDLVVTVRINFNKDGSLAADPRVMNHDARPVFQAATESVLRALRACSPYSFLPVAKYEAWKDIIIDFDPRDMFRG